MNVFVFAMGELKGRRQGDYRAPIHFVKGIVMKMQSLAAILQHLSLTVLLLLGAVVSLLVINGCSNAPAPTPQVIIVTATASSPQVIVVTATPPPSVAPTQTPFVIEKQVVVTTTPQPESAVALPTTQPVIVERTVVVTAVPTVVSTPAPQVNPVKPTAPPNNNQSNAAGFKYPAPSVGGTCGMTLGPGEFILKINFTQPLADDEVFDIRSRHADELGKNIWRGVAQTRDNQHTIRASVGNPDSWPEAFGNPAWGHNFLSVAVIRVKNGNQFVEQLSPESNTCELVW